MTTASVNGIEINYKLEGDGPETVVLINGLADDLETWAYQVDALLEAGYRVRLGIDDKLPEVDALAAEFGLNREQVCFIGDDLLDLATIRAVGFGVAVADAVEDVRHLGEYVERAARQLEIAADTCVDR